MPREHGEDGAFIETIGLDDVREVFDAVDGPVILSADVADTLGCSRETARRKLNELYERGDLDRRKVSRRVIYWEPEEDAGGATDTARADPDPTPTHTPGDTGTDTHADESGETKDAIAALRDTLPGSGENLNGRVRAVRDIHDYLKEHGEGQRSDFKSVVDADATGYGSFVSFWNNCMDSGRVIADLPGVESPGEGGHKYRYTGDGSGGS